MHQGVFGPGHIIINAARAKRMLKEEMAALEVRSPKSAVQSQTEPEFEAIDPNGRLVRVNLRSMLRKRDEGGGMKAEARKRKDGIRDSDVDWLIEALVESARRVTGDPAQMIRRLTAAVRWCRRALPRQAAELERMATQAGESGFPAFHHSPAYKRAYRPAYRVILSDRLKPRVSGRAV